VPALVGPTVSSFGARQIPLLFEQYREPPCGNWIPILIRTEICAPSAWQVPAPFELDPQLEAGSGFELFVNGRNCWLGLGAVMWFLGLRTTRGLVERPIFWRRRRDLSLL
jgi:hypothetical protein